jgi:hypothetical protein
VLQLRAAAQLLDDIWIAVKLPGEYDGDELDDDEEEDDDLQPLD